MPKAGEIRKARKSRWCEVRNSPVHGRGIFAARDIPAGTAVIEYAGEVISKNEAERRGHALFEEASKTGGAGVYIFILNGRYDLDGNVPWNDARLINHSCEPNCETEIDEDTRIWVKALRNIPAGTELTFDYNFDLENFEDHPCRCGAPGCLGYIVGQDHWPALRRKLAARERKAVKKKAAKKKVKRAKKAGKAAKANKAGGR